MWRRSDYRSVLGCLAISIAVMLGAASSAAAISAPSLSVSPASPSPAADWSFTFSANPGLGETVTGYEGGIVGVGDGPVSSPSGVSGLAEGAYVFHVRGLGTDAFDQPIAGPFADISFRVDRTPPAPPVPKLVPASPNGTNGWYTSLTVQWSCSDISGASCPPVVIQDAKRAAVARQTARDGAGNVSAEGVTAPFDFDNGTFKPAISSPSNAARVAGEPLFKWVKIVDPTSGSDRFEVFARWSGVGDQLIARAPGNSTQGSRNVRAAPLPEGTSIRWFVRFFDRAGNFRNSDARTFTIIPTPPASPPVITAGPAGPTRVPAPTFAWTGDQPKFSWDVTLAGATAPAQTSGAPVTAKSVTLAALPDGDYTFRVSQVTALNAEGPESTQSFLVDTAKPSPPIITARPAVPTAVPAAFAWTTESGAFSRWQVLDARGAAVKGPSDAVGPSVNVGALPTGVYTFRVSQLDPAGNISDPTDESFTVQLPPGTTAGPVRPTLMRLPKQNAGRLTPRAGRRLATLRPMFRWVRGPKGTTLYNLQVFRVTNRVAGKAPTIVKVISAFPRGTHYRLRDKVRPGQCYVWRVWPYTGTSFTPKPLGISNFCTVSAKVLARNLARAKARQRARSSAVAARVG